MNKLVKLILAASAVVAICASAQEITEIKASTPTSAYLQDGRGVVVRSVLGNCWNTDSYTPADAVGGCVKEIEKPAPVAVAAQAPGPAPAAVVAPAPVSE